MSFFRWNIKSTYNKNKSLLKQLIELRGISDYENFINPPSVQFYFNKFPQEFKKSLVKAKNEILKNIQENNHIIIYGDYDSDGVTATKIIYSTIKDEFKYSNISFFIPNRFKHGYGLSKKAIDEIIFLHKNDKKILFITVDTGITALEESKYIKSLGHNLLITDHHQKLEQLPSCDALVWSEEVVGSTISWFLSKALGSKNLNNLGLVAIATITDLFPVVGINRSIVLNGLKILNHNPPMGIKNLILTSGNSHQLSTYDLGWVIGPRLNAAGRLEDACIAINLLLETEDKKSLELAKELDTINTKRQKATIEMYDIVKIEQDDLPYVIVQQSTNFHDGIIGLVASKLVQKYYRPALVISIEDGIGKGSARSIDGINIIELLRKYNDLFVELGGHPMAAGFCIKQENIILLTQKLNEYIKENILDINIFTPKIDIDLSIPIFMVDISLFEEIQTLMPFGLGNPEPMFCSENLFITDISIIGKTKEHVSLKLSDGFNVYKSVWFGGAIKVKTLGLGDKVDIAYTLSKNVFNNKVNIDLIIKDLKISKF